MWTTDFGSWNNHGDRSNLTVEATVADALNGGDSDWIERVNASGALEAIVADYRQAINAALPNSVSLCGDEFIGPAFDQDYDWGGELDISEIVDGVDLFAIIERHDPDLD